MSLSEFKNFVSLEESAGILDRLFSIRELWFDRINHRAADFRSTQWYTLGAATYLDLKCADDLPDFTRKVEYFNLLLAREFGCVLTDIGKRIGPLIGREVKILAALCPLAPAPGFHIFPPHKTNEYFFGRHHKDLQWRGLFQLPQFPFTLEQVSQHLSFTIPFKLPYLGGGLWVTEGEKKSEYEYVERALYVNNSVEHMHAIREAKRPSLPCDWRITLQCHGFLVDNTVYIYW